MNSLVPHFLPILCFDQPDVQTKRRRYQRSRSQMLHGSGSIRVTPMARQSLRALVTEFRVSHETIRAIVHEGDTGNG